MRFRSWIIYIIFLCKCCWSHFYVPRTVQTHRACRTTPDVKHIDDILKTAGLYRHDNGKEMPDYYKRFFETIDPGVRVYMIQNTPIIYYQIRQAGADTINDNLRYMANLSDPSAVDNFDRDRNIQKSHGATTLKELHSLLLKRSKPQDYNRLIKRARVFTFVSDPVERFMYAVNECYLRDKIPRSLEWKYFEHEKSLSNKEIDNRFFLRGHKFMKSKKYGLFIENNQVTLGTARDIVEGILTGDETVINTHLLTVPNLNHFYLMSNVFREFKPNFVGDFSRLHEEWSHVERMYDVKMPIRFPVDHRKYLRMGRHDTLGLIQAMQSIFQQDPSYLHALCHLYMRDYVCFSIPLPSGCHGNFTGMEKRMSYDVGRYTFFPPESEGIENIK